MGKTKNELRDLAKIQHSFTDWRLTSKKGDEIPEELWEKALSLLSCYTVTKVAGALRLEVKTLRQRATESGVVYREKDGKPKKEQESTTFVEVALPAGASANEREAQGEKGWLISLHRPDGSRLEISPPSFTESKMQNLIQGFLGV